MYRIMRTFWRHLRDRFPAFLDRGREARRLMQIAKSLAASEAPHPGLLALSAAGKVLISLVVPVYNTPIAYLDDLLASFHAQNMLERTEGLFELVLSDDGTSNPDTLRWLDQHRDMLGLIIAINPENRGIAPATNTGIRLARGEWVALIDHDDAIAPYGLERIARALIEHPDCQFLYTDEVITDGSLDPEGFFLKPAFDPVLLSGMNYINHFSVYRRERLLAIGLLRDGFQGSQDYDLVLRYTKDLERSAILHLPYPAYLWRRDGGSFSIVARDLAIASARKALGEHFARDGQPAAILPALDPGLHRPDFAEARAEWPLVSIIIPSCNACALIERLMQGLHHTTDYPDFEILVIDNGSDDPGVLSLYETWRLGPRPFRAEIKAELFNFASAINRGVALARGDVLLLLNNDIEINEPGWLKEMVSCLTYPDAGIVGAKLLYPDGKLQHVGVIAGLGGLAGHWFIGGKRNFSGPMGRLFVRQSLSVVTGACLLLRRECWEQVGPLDEEQFAIAYNDVDFCLRAVSNGFRVIWTPFAELVHHESASRGSDETPANIERFRREQENLRARHRTDILDDPAYNPWWGRGHSSPSNRALTQLPRARPGLI